MVKVLFVTETAHYVKNEREEAVTSIETRAKLEFVEFFRIEGSKAF